LEKRASYAGTHQAGNCSAYQGFNAKFCKISSLIGANWLMPPIWMPIEAKLAKPQRAYVAIRMDI
jgi:hypothetical protein